MEEKTKVSPFCISKPIYLPRDNCAEAALVSPCDPVAITNRFSLGIKWAFLGSIKFGKSVSMPVSIALLSILFIARPKTAIDLPDFSPASAIIFNLPIFEANEVKTILPLLSFMTL